MTKFSYPFSNATVNLSIGQRVIYINILGRFTDEVAFEITQKLNPIIENMPPNFIRVWDASNLSREEFLLSSDCIDTLAEWGRKIKSKKPDSILYLIAPTTLSYGMGRMYQIKSDLDSSSEILATVNDLSIEIKKEIFI